MLYRKKDSMIGGVCAGIAEQNNLDVSLVRIVWGCLIVMGGVGLAAYVIAWIVIPLEGE